MGLSRKILRITDRAPGNEAPKLAELLKTVPKGIVGEATVYHDDDCAYWKGASCDCDPDVEIIEYDSPGGHLEH